MANEDQNQTATKRTGAKPSPAKAQGSAKTTARQEAVVKKTPAMASPTPAPAPVATKSARKTAPQKAPAKTVAATPAKTRPKAPASTKPAAQHGLLISPDEREHMVRMAAYFKAEQRQFAPGFEIQDWADAEREVDDWLSRQRRTD